MRRIALILLSLCLLLPCFSAAESWYGALYTPGTDAPLAEFQAEADEDALLLSTGLLEGWKLRLEVSLPEIQSLLENPDAAVRPLSDAFSAWVGMMHFTPCTGLFTSDLVDAASEKKTAKLSWGDLVMLADLCENALQGSSLSGRAAMLKAILMSGAKDAPEVVFQTDLFEKENALSMTVLRGSDPVETLTLRGDDPSSFRAVMGNAENGKTYYRTVQAEGLGTGEIHILLRGYADARGAGYRSLEDGDLLSEEKIRLSLQEQGSTFRMDYALGPDAALCGSLAGEADISPAGIQTVNIRLYTQKNQDTEHVRLLVSNDPALQKAFSGEARIFDPLSADEAQSAAFTEALNAGMGTISAVLFKVLPVELLLLIIQ